MSQQWWKDDDQLLAALGAALRSERSVPARFIKTGKAAFSRRGIDAAPAIPQATRTPPDCVDNAPGRASHGQRPSELTAPTALRPSHPPNGNPVLGDNAT